MLTSPAGKGNFLLAGAYILHNKDLTHGVVWLMDTGSLVRTGREGRN